MKKKNKITEEKLHNTNNNVPNNNQNMPKRPGCTVSAGCLWFIILVFLTGVSINEYRRSKIRLEMDKLKLEKMKQDSIINDTTPIITPDTLKIGEYQKAYIPLLKMYQQNQKGN